MITELITRGMQLMPAQIPGEWNVQAVVRFDGAPITIMFDNGNVSVSPGDYPDAESEIQYGNKKFCDAVDGTIDFGTGATGVTWGMSKSDSFFEDVSDLKGTIRPGQVVAIVVIAGGASEIEFSMNWQELF